VSPAPPGSSVRRGVAVILLRGRGAGSRFLREETGLTAERLYRLAPAPRAARAWC